jgi:hypothetical protein
MHDAGRVLILLIALVLNLSALGTASAGDWPKDSIVKENSESPDGHYAVLVQSMGAATEQEDNESGVYLADLKEPHNVGKDRQSRLFRTSKPSRFGQGEAEQIARLKTRDTAHSIEEKSKLTESRIKTLQDLLW